MSQRTNRRRALVSRWRVTLAHSRCQPWRILLSASQWPALITLMCTLAGCVGKLSSGPSLGDAPPGGGGSGSVVAGLVPDVSQILVGGSVTFTYKTQPAVAVSQVIWVNEAPGVVSIQAPAPGCGPTCATVTGLAPGIAQLRPYAIINGGRIEAPWQVVVR